MNTPLTDAYVNITLHEKMHREFVLADFARKLERDRARLIEYVQDTAKQLGPRSIAAKLLDSLEADK